MITAYCADSREHARLRAALRDERFLTVASSWAEFDAAAPAASWLLALLPRVALHGVDTLRLGALRRQLPLHPLVVVTMKDADGARCLHGIPLDEVVWLHELEVELPAAARRAGARRFQQSLSELAAAAHHLPVRVREALMAAARSDPPVRSVSELASLLGCDRSTLWYHWRKVVMPASRLRPEDLVDWLLLLYAVAHKRPGRKWSAAAEEIGVHEHTLGRTARRLTGFTLGEIEQGHQPMVLHLFQTRVVGVLLDPTSPSTFRHTAVEPSDVLSGASTFCD